jgi:hypothetical protein
MYIDITEQTEKAANKYLKPNENRVDGIENYVFNYN